MSLVSLQEELQQQQDELKRSNTELEAQAKTLRQSEELLKEQQEELQQVNEELEEKASLLAEQNQKVEQKNREVEMTRMAIEEKELSALVDDLQRLIGTERRRLDSLASADVRSADQGKVLTVGVAKGRHVSAGDTIASVMDCDKPFVVAIFSYRQGQSMKAGTRVKIDDSSFHSGIVTAVLPKTSDKADERFAIPFPQTERRELYAVIKPENSDVPGPRLNVSDSSQTPACTVGRWVTVTRDNGVVPSMSVTWRRLGNLVSSWMGNQTHDGGTGTAPTIDPALRRAGMARLEAALRSPSPPSQALNAEEDWLPTAQSMVSR